MPHGSDAARRRLAALRRRAPAILASEQPPAAAESASSAVTIGPAVDWHSAAIGVAVTMGGSDKQRSDVRRRSTGAAMLVRSAVRAALDFLSRAWNRRCT